MLLSIENFHLQSQETISTSEGYKKAFGIENSVSFPLMFDELRPPKLEIVLDIQDIQWLGPLFNQVQDLC